MQRTRAWRRHQAHKHGKAKTTQPPAFKPQKRWKLNYGLTEKLKRARQLGMCYPIRSIRQSLDQS